MSDIFLIQPPIRDFYLTAKRTIPYGLVSIAAALRRSGFTVDLCDGLATAKARPLPRPPEMGFLEPFYGRPDLSPFALFHRFRHYGYSLEHIAGQARASGAFLVGISSLFTAYGEEALATARAVRRRHPAARIVLGGHHPTFLPETVMQDPAVDFVLRGEGEETLPLLAGALRDGTPLDGVPGLVRRTPDGALQLNPPHWSADLERLPLPALDLVRHSFYRRRGGNSAVVVASRGCPMRCSYCSMGAAAGIPFRRRTVDAVLEEIETAVGHYGVRFIDFEDENLALDKAWLLDLLHRITARFGESALELRAMNGLFPPAVDDPVARAMKRAGFRILNLSLGSTSPDQLQRFRRPDVRTGFENALRLAKAYGLQAVGYIIVGAPGQTAAQSLADLTYFLSRDALVGVSVFYPAPGSRDHADLDQAGRLPALVSCWRSTALPLDQSTSRLEAVTLLRLGRMLNFIKFLQSEERPAEPFRGPGRIPIGIRLLNRFMATGEICGMTPAGEIYAHQAAASLCQGFRQALGRTWPRLARKTAHWEKGPPPPL